MHVEMKCIFHAYKLSCHDKYIEKSNIFSVIRIYYISFTYRVHFGPLAIPIPEAIKAGEEEGASEAARVSDANLRPVVGLVHDQRGRPPVSQGSLRRQRSLCGGSAVGVAHSPGIVRETVHP